MKITIIIMSDDYNKLKELIKMFVANKQQLINLLISENDIKSEKNIKLNKNLTYKEIIDIVGKQRLLDLLKLQSIDEGFRKIDIFKLLSNLKRNHVLALSKELNLPGDTKQECFVSIWGIKETVISEAIKKLYNSNKISGVYQYKNNVLGPIGILNGYHEREHEYGDIIDFLNDFNETEIIKIADSLKIENVNKSKEYFLQKILTNYDNERIILAIQQLTSEKQIQIPRISKWSNLIVTSCGIFEKKKFILHPKEELRDFLLKEVSYDELMFVISHELGIDENTFEIESILLEYCVNNPPEEVIKKFFRYSDILKHAKKIFHQNPPKSIPENEIINCILSTLGFDLPQRLVGLKKYQEILKDVYDKTDISVDDVRLIANETDRILKDLIKFYSKFLWDIEEDEDFKKIIKDKLEIEKSCSKLSTGDLVGILRNINKFININKNITDKMNLEFNRNYLIHKKTLKILNDWVTFRNSVIHANRPIVIKETNEILKKITDFSNDIQRNIYPLVVRLEKEEIDKYGTHFVIFEDERGNKHRVLRSGYIETSVYFMSPSNKPLRINPFIVKRDK